MMFKKIRNIIVIIIFLMISVFSEPLKLIYASSFSSEEKNKTSEPQGTNFVYLLTYVSNDYSNKLVFKNNIKNLYSKLDYILFKHTNSDALFGKNEWSFYNCATDFSPVEMVQSKYSFSNDELIRYKNTIDKNINYAQSKIINLYYLILPNKENIYREFLPDYVKIYDEKSRVEKYIDYLNYENVIYPKDFLINAKKDYQIYYKNDTHWNSLGAYFAYKYFMKKTQNIEVDDPNEISLSYIKDLGDINNISYIHGIYGDYETKVNYGNITELNEKEIDGIKIYSNPNAKYDKTIIIIGDSYRNAISQYFYADYNKVIILHRENFSKEIINIYNPNTIILEYVERYFNQSINICPSI